MSEFFGAETLNFEDGDEKLWVEPKSYTAEEIERRFEKSGEAGMHASKMPRVGGVINLHVEIDENKKFHARKYIIKKPGKDGAEIVRFDFGNLVCPSKIVGDVELSFTVLEKKDGVVTLGAPEEILNEAGLVTRPVAYDRKGFYTMSDGRQFIIATNDTEWINVETGFAVDPDKMSASKFPVLEMQGMKDGYYYGSVLSPDELRKRRNIEAAFAQYYRKSKLTELEHEQYALAPTNKDLDRACAEIREASQVRPLEVVVSSQGRIIRNGFENFSKYLNQMSGNSDLVRDLSAACEKARVDFALFENQRNVEGSKDTLETAGFWNNYTTFFKLLDSDEAKQALGISNIRRRFFPSDLDGETALEVFNMAGVRTQVFPFTPDVSRTEKPYIDEAIHLDISHGTQNPIRRDKNFPWRSTTVFLDENDETTFSATHATFNHLNSLRFLENDYFAEELVQLINEEDSFKGFYETQKGCVNVLNNKHINIYGLGQLCIGAGHYDLIIELLKQELPKIRASVLQEFPDLKDNPKKYRTIVLRKLLTLDIRPFLYDAIGTAEVDMMSEEVKGVGERSLEALRTLERKGYSGTSIFGKTLFDPFGKVEHRGLEAFAAGYDCYVSYNNKNSIGMINLSPFRRKKVKIPSDLYGKGDAQIGSVIKNGAYFVMNSSGKKFRNFEEMARPIIGKNSTPEGVRNYLNIGANLYKKIFPGWVLDAKGRRPARATEEVKTRNTESIITPEFNDKKVLLNEALSKLMENPGIRFGEEAVALRKQISVDFQVMLEESEKDADVEGKKVYDELIESTLCGMGEDFAETFRQAMGVAAELDVEKAAANFDRAEFMGHLQVLIYEDTGLGYYEEVFPEFRSRFSEDVLKNI
jgi:hypothetical protein